MQQWVPGLRQGRLRRPRLERPADVVAAHRDLLRDALDGDGRVGLLLRLAGMGPGIGKGNLVLQGDSQVGNWVDFGYLLCSVENVDPAAFGRPMLVAGAADDGACDGAELGKVPEDGHGPDVVVVDAVDGYLGPDSIVDWLELLA